MSKVKLGVNIDHVATLRQARGTIYPDPIEAAMLAIDAGADGITLHLREDRRHIQDHDVKRMKTAISVPMNLEMAVTPEMLDIACEIKPEKVCLVPEKREEVTTEGGLNVVANEQQIREACERMAQHGIEVSLFIDPSKEQIDAAVRCGAPVIEIHTGAYADAENEQQQQLLEQIKDAAAHAHQQGLIVNAGHGLHAENTKPIAEIANINELNIGHSIVARAVFVGIGDAVRELKALL